MADLSGINSAAGEIAKPELSAAIGLMMIDINHISSGRGNSSRGEGFFEKLFGKKK